MSELSFLGYDDPDYQKIIEENVAKALVEITKPEITDREMLHMLVENYQTMSMSARDSYKSLRKIERSNKELVEKFLIVDEHKPPNGLVEFISQTMTLPIDGWTRDQLLVFTAELRCHLSETSRNLQAARKTIANCCSKKNNAPAAPPKAVEPLTSETIDMLFKELKE